jgi:hypothetical protein
MYKPSPFGTSRNPLMVKAPGSISIFDSLTNKLENNHIPQRLTFSNRSHRFIDLL